MSPLEDRPVPGHRDETGDRADRGQNGRWLMLLGVVVAMLVVLAIMALLVN